VAKSAMCDEQRVRRGREESKRTLIGTLFELLVLGGLIDELQNLISREPRHEWIRVEKGTEARKKVIPGCSVGLLPGGKSCFEDRPFCACK